MKLGTLNRDELIANIENAKNEDTAKEIMESVQALIDFELADKVAEYKAMANEVQADASKAAKYGLRTLTKEEKQFYKSLDPRQAAVEVGVFKTDQDNVIPTTIVDEIMEDLRRDRPLFNYINWAPAGVRKWLVGAPVGKAVWGKIDATIAAEMTATLDTFNIDVNKLTAFAQIPNALFDIGFPWIDKFVREILLEAAADGLEEAIIKGDGVNQPLGLLYTVEADGTPGAVKAKKAVTGFDVENLGEHMNTLTNDGKDQMPKLVMIVATADKYTTIAGATQFLTAGGEYRTVFPYNVDIVDTPHLDAGTAILYVPNTYTAGVTEMGVTRSTDFKFLEDLLVYKVVTYGNGRLRHDYQAVVLNVADVEPLAFNVKGLVTPVTPVEA